MTRLLKETDIKEGFTEHDLGGKVVSNLAAIERATDLLGHASKQIAELPSTAPGCPLEIHDRLDQRVARMGTASS